MFTILYTIASNDVCTVTIAVVVRERTDIEVTVQLVFKEFEVGAHTDRHVKRKWRGEVCLHMVGVAVKNTQQRRLSVKLQRIRPRLHGTHVEVALVM